MSELLAIELTCGLIATSTLVKWIVLNAAIWIVEVSSASDEKLVSSLITKILIRKVYWSLEFAQLFLCCTFMDVVVDAARVKFSVSRVLIYMAESFL